MAPPARVLVVDDRATATTPADYPTASRYGRAATNAVNAVSALTG
jgi:hypothetical protein